MILFSERKQPTMPKFVKGHSGNPRGRPKKSRTLSNILEAKAEDLTLIDGSNVKSNQELVALRLWEFATTGEVNLPSGTLRAENVNDWVNAVRWIYTHIDGPAPSHNTDDHITITIERLPPGLLNQPED